MEEIPKLHGWITPEYATQILIDILNYLEKVLPFDKYTEFINKLDKIIEFKASVQNVITEFVDNLPPEEKNANL